MSCTPICENVFSELRVMPLIRGGTRVAWELHPHFADPGPYTFQLQFGRTGNPLADDWVNVGPAVTDTYYADDGIQRIYGMQLRCFYRVSLTTAYGEYTSKPYNLASAFDYAETQYIRNLMYQEQLRLKFKAGNDGYLLKRRVFGQKCSCVDAMTDETRVNSCELCYDTGITGGYFEPYPCVYAEFTTRSTREHVTDTATTNDGPVCSCLMINEPQVNSYDVWVDKEADTRWCVHTIQSKVEVRSVPIILTTELRMFPFSHVIYKLPIVGQQS